ncbi:MAG: glycosyltransferase family 2 protein, partial [Candidatus Fonsibacter ubiquis]
MSKISICIPTYEYNGNGVLYLKELIGTIRKQTFLDFDIVISDHSTDDKILEYVETLKNEFEITYIKNSIGRGSSSSNINVAIKNSKSEIIKIIFQDDLFFSDDYLENVVKQFEISDKKWLVSACNHTNGEIYYKDFYPEWNQNILTNNTFSSPSTISVLRDYVEYFDENLKMLMDTDFYYRMFHIHGEPIYLNDVKISNREHSQRISDNMQLKSDYQINLKKEIDHVYNKNQKIYFNFLKKNSNKSEYYLNYKIDRCGPPWFGACISWITAMYSLALINEAKFYMASNDNWRLVPNDEDDKNWHYFFESLELSEWKEEENDLNTGKYSIRFEDKLFKQLGRITESGKEDQTVIGNPLTFCPEEFCNPNLSKEENLLLFKSFCLRDIYKPKKEYINISSELLDGIGDYISVHIRRGD